MKSNNDANIHIEANTEFNEFSWAELGENYGVSKFNSSYLNVMKDQKNDQLQIKDFIEAKNSKSIARASQ